MAGSCANPTIGIMSRLRTLFVFGFLAFAPSKECCICLLTKFGLA
jgi:hypothetical protein